MLRNEVLQRHAACMTAKVLGGFFQWPKTTVIYKSQLPKDIGIYFRLDNGFELRGYQLHALRTDKSFSAVEFLWHVCLVNYQLKHLGFHIAISD